MIYKIETVMKFMNATGNVAVVIMAVIIAIALYRDHIGSATIMAAFYVGWNVTGVENGIFKELNRLAKEAAK